MQLADAKIKLTTMEASILILLILGIISSGIIFLGVVPHLPIIMSIVLLMVYGRRKGLSFEELEGGLIKGATTGLGAVYIFFFIGMLISSWMASGTIPTLMYGGFKLFSGTPIYLAAFIICSVLGISIGSAFTTAATIGVAFLGMAAAMDASLAIMAGAVVSGAFLGDKMSPVSDTTNLASGTFGVSLFEHIKNMLWTTVPGFIISAILFWILSPGTETKTGEIKNFIQALQAETSIGWTSLIPFILVTVFAIRKVSAIPTLSVSILSAVAISFMNTKEMTLAKMSSILFSGFVMESDFEQLNTILSRGGVESMMFSISLVLLALGLGGLLFMLGIIPALLKFIERFLTSTLKLAASTVATAISINVLIGEQYLSILLTGSTFQSHFERLKLSKKTLSRILEDSGTVINPLIPWGVSGVFLTEVLGVSTLQYVPFTFFCLLCPILTLVSVSTKIGISNTES
ncbi:Na+/H+ antiporter NhaC [Peribacillus acanthi]|uniref:Na+/H+ antiporter NhaC n=1 Tax=Peribacillus acanthi TaxID=2171554 RepID=UPI000D3E3451|nr:Na+/H+ antiporter NhaC [Peribacillus acanthi]